MHEKRARLLELIKRQFALAYFDAKRCHKTLFTDTNSFETEQKALIFLYRAARHMDLAYAIYQHDLEELEHYALTPTFAAFDTFYHEVTNNVATNHSHQWSDIEFDRYIDSIYDWVPEARKED